MLNNESLEKLIFNLAFLGSNNDRLSMSLLASAAKDFLYLNNEDKFLAIINSVYNKTKERVLKEEYGEAIKEENIKQKAKYYYLSYSKQTLQKKLNKILKEKNSKRLDHALANTIKGLDWCEEVAVLEKAIEMFC